MEIIAEVGQYHDGSIDRLFKLVENLCLKDIDTIKLQHHIASAESSASEQFRVKFSEQYDSRYDYWEKMQIGIENLGKIKKICEDNGKQFLCTPFSLQAVDELITIGVDRFKIGSADVSNSLLLKHVSKFKKPVIISNGLRSLASLHKAIDILSACPTLTILHCTTSYPTALEDVNFKEIALLKQNIPNSKIGLSDHTGTVWPAVFALASNLSAVELHVAYSRQDFGPDTTSSITFEELDLLVEARAAWRAVNELPTKKIKQALHQTSKVFSRSVKLRRDVKAGTNIETKYLETFKPAGLGLSPEEMFLHINKKFPRDLPAGHIIKVGDLT